MKNVRFKMVVVFAALVGCGLLVAGIMMGSEAKAEDVVEEPAVKRKVLFIAGAPSHGNGEHEFRAGCMLLADAINASGVNVEAKVHFYGWPKDLSVFDDVDGVVVFADAGGRMNKQVQELMDKRVKAGMGIMFMHYGVHPSKEVGEKYYGPWTGQFMETGWSVNPHWIADMDVAQDHPVGRGLKDGVEAYDEFYFNMRKLHPEGDCGCCKDLAVATPTPEKVVRYINLWNKHGDACFGTKQGLMWSRDQRNGSGRGVGFVGGHYHRNWAIDEFRMLVLNAVVWMAKGEVPEGGVKSKPVTKEMLNANLDRPNAKKPIELPTDVLLKQKAMKRPVFE